MLASATALFVEYLVIGTVGWLWLGPFLLALNLPPGLSEAFRAQQTLAIAAVVIISYVLGVTTESLSWGLERIVLGRTSQPRAWVRNRLQPPTDDEWHAAQHWIWSSDQAYKEFIYSRLRVMISRGIAANALIGFVLSISVPPLTRILASRDFLAIVLASYVFLFLLSGLSWLLGTIEYRARVKVAGKIKQ